MDSGRTNDGDPSTHRDRIDELAAGSMLDLQSDLNINTGTGTISTGSHRRAPGFDSASSVRNATAALVASLDRVAPKTLRGRINTLSEATTKELAQVDFVLNAAMDEWDRIGPTELANRCAGFPAALHKISDDLDDCDDRGGTGGYDEYADGGGCQGVEEAERIRKKLRQSKAPDAARTKTQATAFSAHHFSAIGHIRALLAESNADCDGPNCCAMPVVVCYCQYVSGDRLCSHCDSVRHEGTPCDKRYCLVKHGDSPVPVVRALLPNEYIVRSHPSDPSHVPAFGSPTCDATLMSDGNNAPTAPSESVAENTKQVLIATIAHLQSVVDRISSGTCIVDEQATIQRLHEALNVVRAARGHLSRSRLESGEPICRESWIHTRGVCVPAPNEYLY
jgi:hypothetical protein